MPPFSNSADSLPRKVAAYILKVSGLLLALIVALATAGCLDKSGFQIAAGGDSSFVISGGKVYAAGKNLFGQLGFGDNTDRDAFTEVLSLSGKNIVAIAARGPYSLALDKEGKVYATGWNGYGQLGLGDKTDRDKFTQISSLKDKKIVAISAGYDNSLALTSDGKVYAAGNNQYGQLGLGDNTDRDAFTEVASLNGKNIVAITAGGSSFAIAKDGKVYATGWNKNGGINMGKQKEEHKIFIEVKDLSGKHISAVAIGESHILALDKEGKVYGAGLSQYGQLGLGAYEEKARATFTEITDLSDKNIVAVAAGNTRSLALAKNGKIYAAGNNKYGGLGLGDSGEETSRDIFEEALSLNDKNIIAIATGFWHTLALGKDGKVYGAGHNNSGQLALGDNTDRDIFTLIPTK